MDNSQFNKELDNNNIDRLLIDLVNKGNMDAFESLFKKYHKELYTKALIYCKNSYISEELVNDFFIRLWAKRGTIVIEKSVKLYFSISIKNAALNYLRKQYPQNTLIEEAYDIIASNSASDEIEAAELQDILNTAIESLPEKCKQLFKLSRNEDLSYAEIAKKTGLKIKTVENQIGIALKKIKDFIKGKIQF